MKIAVLGLGRMGLPIACRLALRHQISAFDPTWPSELCSPEAGIRRAADAADASDGAEVLVTVLPGPHELTVALRDPAVLESRPLWIDMTSCDPRTGTHVHRAAAALGSRSLAAPMRGGPDDAKAGTLGFYLGGDTVAIDAALPLLLELGPDDRRDIVSAEQGQAYTAKLLANLLWFGQVVASPKS